MKSSYVWARRDLSTVLGYVQVDGHTWRKIDGYEISVDGDKKWAVNFHVEVDDKWHTRITRVSVLSSDEDRSLELVADGAGRWTVDGRPSPDLQGCLDVDISATPFTNTFVIRRIGLAVGEEISLPVAWVAIPAATVERFEQTYIRHAPIDGYDRYEYRDSRHGAWELTVDHDGVVIEYEGFASRLIDR